jgi:hypothetical protein
MAADGPWACAAGWFTTSDGVEAGAAEASSSAGLVFFVLVLVFVVESALMLMRISPGLVL